MTKKNSILVLFITGSFLTLAGCGAEVTPSGDITVADAGTGGTGGSTGPCKANETKSCMCGSTAGALICKADGSGYGECSCTSGTGGTGGSTGTGGTGGSGPVYTGTITTFSRDWVYKATGSKMCANPAFMSDTPSAELMIWEGPDANLTSGPLTGLDKEGYCWDFASKASGLRRFWFKRPGAKTGAEYGSASVIMNLPVEARKWIWCGFDGCGKGPNGTDNSPCGCDGKAEFTSGAWSPKGNM